MTVATLLGELSIKCNGLQLLLVYVILVIAHIFVVTTVPIVSVTILFTDEHVRRTTHSCWYSLFTTQRNSWYPCSIEWASALSWIYCHSQFYGSWSTTGWWQWTDWCVMGRICGSFSEQTRPKVMVCSPVLWMCQVVLELLIQYDSHRSSIFDKQMIHTIIQREMIQWILIFLVWHFLHCVKFWACHCLLVYLHLHVYTKYCPECLMSTKTETWVV